MGLLLTTASSKPRPGRKGEDRRVEAEGGEEAIGEPEPKREGQEYAQVVKMLGSGRCECFCYDGVTRLGHMRGEMRKKGRVAAGDAVLVEKRGDVRDERADVLRVCTAQEARSLKQYGELPEAARISNETFENRTTRGDDDGDDIGISFDDI